MSEPVVVEQVNIGMQPTCKTFKSILNLPLLEANLPTVVYPLPNYVEES